MAATPHSEAQARYKRTEKGKAAQQRYHRSPAHRAACARYRATQRGQQMEAKTRARRILIGKTHLGYAQTIEQAEALKDYARERIREFREAQCR